MATRNQFRKVFGATASVLYEARALALYGSSARYRAYSFDELSGTTIADSGSAASGTLNKTGTPTLGSAGAGLSVGDTGIDFTGLAVDTQYYSNSVLSIGRATATVGGMFLVAKVTTQQTAIVKILWEHCDVAAPFPSRMGMQLDATGHLRFSTQVRNANGSRNWVGAVDYRNTGYHMFAVVQRADGTGVHMFVDGVEIGTTMTTGGTAPTINVWFNESMLGVAGADTRMGFMVDQRTLGSPQFYTAGSIASAICIDGIAPADAEIAELAALVVP